MISDTVGRRVALITGAAQGIGEAIAIRFADDPGHIDVAVLDVPGKEHLLNDIASRIEAKGRRALAIVGDVSVEEQVKAAVRDTVDVLGSLDIVSTRVCFVFERVNQICVG